MKGKNRGKNSERTAQKKKKTRTHTKIDQALEKKCTSCVHYKKNYKDIRAL